MERSQRIAEILGKRNQTADRVNAAKKAMEGLRRLLIDLEKQRYRVQRHLDPGAPDLTVLDQLGEKARILQSQVQAEIAELGSLHARFSRSTLNVAVVGQPRQGKSRLLQSLSGLTPAEIPSAASLPHTAVRSVIQHDSDATPAWALVTCYTKQEFVDEIITPYYDRLLLGRPPLSFDEFRSQDLPSLRLDLFAVDDTWDGSSAGTNGGTERLRRLRIGRARAEAEYGSLRSIRDRVDAFATLLTDGPSEPRRIPGSEILTYVAQRDAKERNGASQDSGGRELANYLAVRKVEVFCRFPDEHRGVDRVAFIDMPGLGQTVVGDEQRLKEMLNDQVDFVLYVKMPSAAGAGWLQADVDLYDIISSSVPENFLDDFSLLVLNHNRSDGDNLANCIALAETLDEARMGFADYQIADCASPADVLERVLDPVLGKMSRGVGSLDQEFLETRRIQVGRILSRANELIAEAREAVDKAEPSTLMRAEAHRLFVSQFERLALALYELRHERRAREEAEDPRFARAFATAVEACRENSGMPSVQEIYSGMAVAGDFLKAYISFADGMRRRMTLHFAALDQPLREMTRECKRDIVSVLVDAGGLGGISTDRTDKYLHDLVAKTQRTHRALRSTFDALARFELSYWGLVLLQVRRSLEWLSADSQSFPMIGAEPTVETVMHVLQDSRDRTIYEISTHLRNKIESPNRILYAVVDNFYDQLLADDVRGELRLFYEDHQAAIWPTKYESLSRRKEEADTWHEILDLMEGATDSASL